MNREINIGAVNPNACAACKHQRKKCDESCELAPYFPASRYGEFQHAQKLFGISNIQKIINSVQPNQRHAAAESILMEGNIRYNDPVHGCVGVVCRLKSQIALYQSQLNAVHQQLNILREREKQKHFEGLTKGSSPSSSSPFAAPTLIQNDFDAFNFQPPTPPTHLVIKLAFNLKLLSFSSCFYHIYNLFFFAFVRFSKLVSTITSQL